MIRGRVGGVCLRAKGGDGGEVGYGAMRLRRQVSAPSRPTPGATGVPNDGLRQQGSACGAAFMARLKPSPFKTNASFGTAKAVPFQNKCFLWHG